MSLTPEQRQVAEAWASLSSEAFTTIFADLKDHIKTGITGSLEKAGAWDLAGHILHRRDALRAEKARGPQQPVKGRVKSG